LHGISACENERGRAIYHDAGAAHEPRGQRLEELTTPELFVDVSGSPAHPEQLAVDDWRVYFHLSDTGTILSVCK